MYKEIVANIWDFKDDVKVITTNGAVYHGKAVMGAGLALQASSRYDLLPNFLGIEIISHGNHCYYFPDYKIITFPTKSREFWKKSSYDLIIQSMNELIDICKRNGIDKIIFPHVGCKNGGLKWENVKEKILKILYHPNINFVVVDL